jgi:hypothetical protein
MIPKLPSNSANLGGLTTLGAAVVILNVAVALPFVELRETDDGLTVQPILAVEDERLHERFTVPLNPPVPLTVMVEVPVCPDEEIVTLGGFAETE